ncbi:hypothetical protein NDU88_002952 [Pleurodeles waltl]|uniref:Uncharacterized protein n=1 Tax=Pleurodeles waltl TaxID=8319 RepID=A0AAV7QAC1_PLEWA|nr:hypothetical protein NDU88_002952 [Pleurodeles waltl]
MNSPMKRSRWALRSAKLRMRDRWRDGHLSASRAPTSRSSRVNCLLPLGKGKHQGRVCENSDCFCYWNPKLRKSN